MNVLFTGVGRRIEILQAFRNAALVLNKELKIYGADMAGTAPALAYCDYTCKVVAMKDVGYIGNVLQICKEDRIRIYGDHHHIYGSTCKVCGLRMKIGCILKKKQDVK